MFGIRSAVFVMLLAATAGAEVVSFEGDVFPEELGWERVGTLDADRWIDDGWFFQSVELGVWAPGPLGEADFYQRSLADFAREQVFFIEWRVETDVPSSILDSSGIPVALVAGGGGSVAVYHTTITDARVQLLRDTFIPLVFVDIEPGVPHTYRLELSGAELYAWYIDGQLVDSGIPQGPYPNDDSVLIWGARHDEFDNTTGWDYVRFGTIPIEGSGDFDSDTQVALDDFFFVQECLSHSGPDTDAGPGCRFADFNADTDVDLQDIASFQNAFGQ